MSKELPLSRDLDFRFSMVETFLHQFSLPVVTVALNTPFGAKIPGSSLLFEEALSLIQTLTLSISAHIICKEMYWAAYVVHTGDGEIFSLKEKLVVLEEEHPLGRLFDFDVYIEQSGHAHPVSREVSKRSLRSCFLCDAPAIACRREKRHTLFELEEWVNSLVSGFLERKILVEKCLERLDTLVSQSMILEAVSSPKPGLVDGRSSGIHEDMGLVSMVKSAFAISPEVRRCAEIGAEAGLRGRKEAKTLFPLLRKTGIRAEEAMFTVTSGINTHKGMIFSMGLICAAAGFSLGRCRRPQSFSEFVSVACRTASAMSQGIVSSDLTHLSESDILTKGERNWLKYQSSGIRGEAEAGFPAIIDTGLEELVACIQRNVGTEKTIVRVLLAIMSVLDDGIVLSKGGLQSLKEVKQLARESLEYDVLYGGNDIFTQGEAFEKLELLCVENGFSCGGAADLTAVICLLWLLSKELEFPGSH